MVMRNTINIVPNARYFFLKSEVLKIRLKYIFNFIDDTFPFCQLEWLFNLPNYVNQQLENLPQYCNFIYKAPCVLCIVLICIGSWNGQIHITVL